MKIGLDVHGVVSANPKFWEEMTAMLVSNGHEVHIITGHPHDSRLMAELRDYKVKWTHIFSIVDHHKTVGTYMWRNKKGEWEMGDRNWNKTKAEYCEKHGINLHFDDSWFYEDFFTTPYARYMSKDRLDKKREANRDQGS
jgi:hypothetical protein